LRRGLDAVGVDVNIARPHPSQLLQWTMQRQRKIEHPVADTVDPAQGAKSDWRPALDATTG
jgi:hypothetical protein